MVNDIIDNDLLDYDFKTIKNEKIASDDLYMYVGMNDPRKLQMPSSKWEM